MDTTSALPPSIKVEGQPSTTSASPSSESNPTKQEQPDMTNTHTVDLPPPPFMKSITELRSLSTSLSTFLRRYDELHDHLNFIKTSIDSKLSNHVLHTSSPSLLTDASCANAITAVPETVVPEQKPTGTATNRERSVENVKKPEKPDLPEKREETETDTAKKPEETDTKKKRGEIGTKKKRGEAVTKKKRGEIGSSKKPEETDISKKPEETEISKKPEETDISKKPEETEISKKPAVSELESCCERMCGRDLKRYVATHISDMNKLREEIPKALKLARNPAKLVLDSIGRFFVQGHRSFIKGSHMIVGRLASVAILECFVMISSDSIQIAKEEKEHAAKAAVDWRRRMIQEGGLTKTDEVDARGLLLLISGFGIPDHVFHNEDIRDLLRASNVKGISSALRRSIILIPKIPEIIDWLVKNRLEVEAADIAYTFGLEDKCHPQTILTTFLHKRVNDKLIHGSSAQMNATMKRQLSDLKSVKRCLEDHKVDPAKFLPDCKINEKIQQFEKKIRELDSKSSEERSTRKRKVKEGESPSRNANENRNGTQLEPKRPCLTSHDNDPCDQKPVDPYGKSPYNGFPGAYPTSSTLRAPGFSETLPSSVAGGSSMVTGSYHTGPYGGTYPDQMANTAHVQPYDWHEDSALIEKYLGQSYSRQGQTYESQPSTTGLIGLYSRHPGRSSLETFPGLPSSSPSVGFPGRGGPPADLYSFADTVVENEPYRGGSYASGGGSGSMRSSYF